MTRVLRVLFPFLFVSFATPLLAVQLPATRPADPALDYARPNNSNPLLPGYFADPSLLQTTDGHFFLYATVDPWGANTLGCWSSTDFTHWTYHLLNWPTKAACTSPTSKSAMVWAPSVIQMDGHYYMYVSCGSEVWCGAADNPLGPWHSMLPPHTPLIPATFNKTYHMIDQECFVDDDGSVYLYWGSGWNWKNGHCFVVKLNSDMHSFATEPRDVTPAHYFEAPFMMKRHGIYFLMYSDGNTTKDTYQVRYATGPTPFGPFTESPTSPILKTDITRDVISPGHHAMFRFRGQDFILYHRAALPLGKQVLRQICVDPITWQPDGQIAPVIPTHTGASIIQRYFQSADTPFTPRPLATASSSAGPAFSADRATDNDFATRWQPAPDAQGPQWLQLDLGAVKNLHAITILPEYPTHTYHFTLDSSADAHHWTTLTDATHTGLSGSPISYATPITARYLRITFTTETQPADISLWEFRAE